MPRAVVHELNRPRVDVEPVTAFPAELIRPPRAFKVLVEFVVVDEVVVHVVPFLVDLAALGLLLRLLGRLGRGAHGGFALLVLDDGRVVGVASVVDHVLLAVGLGRGVVLRSGGSVGFVVVVVVVVGVLESRRGVEALDAADDLRHVVPAAARELILGPAGWTAGCGGGRAAAAHARVDGRVASEGILVVATPSTARRGGSARASAPGVRFLLELLVVDDGHRVRVQFQRDVPVVGREGGGKDGREG